MSNMIKEKEILDEIKIVKQLLIAQLVLEGVAIKDISKITGLSNNGIYAFLPKNLGKKKNE